VPNEPFPFPAATVQYVDEQIKHTSVKSVTLIGKTDPTLLNIPIGGDGTFWWNETTQTLFIYSKSMWWKSNSNWKAIK